MFFCVELKKYCAFRNWNWLEDEDFINSFGSSSSTYVVDTKFVSNL